ncbi:enoyl-CoA hydratase/isomerase family protein [Bradyrhizobium viridifuturi]|uniref:enoyl-CoA hydratase/isomerase family protein n=1 Tax=uncultured Bradyrhizobium sp. TaxID=199684 RepID=UPI001BA5AFC9|nr:enoyl-CoA hydratase/isomerase family protein [uncultured Bradyrhizobium sp.]MBR1040676.1 enoyl-CoA hydratase/isomerase family protein [Bradyrhizobium viridifuturi]MBR1074964.1 enoyl-CoA hydratase/isomerase family protein [Bradyrhizobium viridifuturi]
MSDPVNVSVEGSVGIIELARPEKSNCLSLEAHECISRAREKFEADRNVRSILICAQGKHFCTGADLTEVKSKLMDAHALDYFIAFGMEGLRKLEQSRLPVIVAVQGLCLAGGIELMLSCDVCFAAESAQFGDQHAQFGLIPGWGGSQRLTRLMGLRRALDLMFSARWLKADEAKEAGLVNYIVPDGELRQAALAYCQKIATRSRPGIAEMKRLAREGADMATDQQMRLERDAAVRALPSEDVAEGLNAFENRRTPAFKA